MPEAGTQRLIDRQAIEDVLSLYCRGVDRCDEATLAACYHPDAEDDHGTFKGNGHDFAAWACRGAARYWAASHHSVHNVLIDWIDDDTARVESYVLAFNRRVGEAGEVEIFAGRYLDRFKRRANEWRISHRLALRDVDTLTDYKRWAGKITAGGRFPNDPLYPEPEANIKPLPPGARRGAGAGNVGEK